MEVSDGLAVPQRYWAMLTVTLAVTMAVLDGAIANIALPTIAVDLQTTPAESINPRTRHRSESVRPATTAATISQNDSLDDQPERSNR